MKVGGVTQSAAYVAILVATVLFKAALVWDLDVVRVFSPHDDSLYVVRAFSLLNGDAFGPYDSRTLAKLPGLSLWLAGTAWIGLPHLLAVNALYLAAGLYFLAGARHAGAGRALCAAAFLLYALNPITTSEYWHRTIREPLSTGLFVLMLAAMLHLFLSGVERKRIWPHLGLLGVTFAFSLLVREEDKLLWGVLALSVLVLLLQKIPLRLLVAIAVFPALLALTLETVSRRYVERHYGMPMLNDFSEGEFPRLVASIRSVETEKENRLVMAPQETLQRLRKLVPEFAPVVERLPPPGPGTYSCKLQGVCSEWSNGWMPWWIKDAAAAAGTTPDLPSAQRYFGAVRLHIETACQSGELKCRSKGQGLVPPIELRWAGSYLREVVRLLLMTFDMRPNVVHATPIYNSSPKLDQMYRDVTMTNPARGDAENPLARWRDPLSRMAGLCAMVLLLLGVIALFARWALYPAVPPDPLFRVASVFLIFAGLRIAALAYVATFFGPFEYRILFATHAAAVLLSPFLIAGLFRAAQGTTKPR